MRWPGAPPGASPCRPQRSAVRGSSGGTGDAGEFFPSPGLWEHAPSFGCGVVTALVLQCLVRFMWTSIMGKELGCVELRHMTKALHEEVDAARELLAECRGERRLGVANTTWASAGVAETTTSWPGQTTATSTMVDPVVHVVNVASLHEDNGNTGNTTLAAPSVAAARPEPSESTASGRLWSLALLLLDTGLVYFCCIQSGLRAAFDAKAAEALTYWRSLLEAKDAPPPAQGGDSQTTLPPLTPIDPSGGAVMVRRRAQPSFSLRRKDPDFNMKWRMATGALVSASLFGVLILRALVGLVGTMGFRFIEHVVAYLVVTGRVCLMVLLILF